MEKYHIVRPRNSCTCAEELQLTTYCVNNRNVKGVKQGLMKKYVHKVVKESGDDGISGNVGSVVVYFLDGVVGMVMLTLVVTFVRYLGKRKRSDKVDDVHYEWKVTTS